MNSKTEAFRIRNVFLLSVAALALALLAPALNPSNAQAVGGEYRLDSPPTMGYTTMEVTAHVHEDLTQFLFAYIEIAEDPNAFTGCCGSDIFYFPGANEHEVKKTFTGLKPGTTYYVRISGSAGESNVISGTTKPVAAPSALDIDDASSVSFTSAHFSGEVEGVEGPDPAFESTCQFQVVSVAEYEPRNEVQELTVRATGGTFQLGYGGELTPALAYNASAAAVQSALQALTPIGAGNVTVAGGPGDKLGDSPYTISFQGSLAATDVEQIGVDGTGLKPEGDSGADTQTPINGHGQEKFNRAISFPCDPATITTTGATAVEGDAAGLEAGTEYHLRLLISNAGGSDAVEANNFTTLSVPAPSVLSVDDATNVGFSLADVSGEVERPAGSGAAFDVNCYFEYVPAAQFLASGFQGAPQAPCNQNPVTGTGPTPVDATLSQLSLGTTYYYRLVAVNSGGKDVVRATNPFTTGTPNAPTVAINAVDTIGAHTAHFSGKINPGDDDPASGGSWHFECTPACPGLEDAFPPGTSDQLISRTATGLKANTEYQVSLVASNAAATATAGPVAFKTLADDPVVTTMPAFAIVGGTEAFVGGKIDPENSETDYWFEWGEDDTYGNSIPSTEDGDAGSADDPTFVRERISGLVPGAEYHFRLVAENQAGVVSGNDLTFTTPTGDLGTALGDLELPDDRSWEMVSPPDKNRADIWKIYPQTSIDGERVVFKSQGSFAGLPTAKGANLSDYMAKRGPGETGWQTEGMTPNGGLFCFICGAVEFDEALNFTHFSWRERANESPDDEFDVPEDSLELLSRQYLRDNETKNFKFIPDAPTFRISADGSHFAISTNVKVTSEPVCTTSVQCVFETADGGFTWDLVSVLPDDTATEGTLIGISRDGSRIYFSSAGKNYVRVGGEDTIEIDGSGGTSVVAIEGDAGDGSRAVLRSNEQLLPADQDAGDDFYVWDGSQAPGERLTLLTVGDIPGVEAELGNLVGFDSDRRWVHDLDRGYFTANNQILAGEPDEAGTKLYAWELVGDQVDVSYVATYATLNDHRSSDNNAYLTFTSNDRLTAYDNKGIQEVYLYDLGADRLVCVSCEPEGSDATAEGRLYFISLFEGSFGADHAKRNVTDDGRVFFESLENLAAHDSNGEPDVYEYVDGLPQLISKGTGPHESRIADVDASGDNVFFLTDDQLSGWDTDRSFDVYVARVGGGLPEPPVKKIPCEGDSCQPLPNPPNDPTPASEVFKGAGNVPPPKKCKKGKVLKRGKCVKKKHKKHGKKKSTRKNG